MAKKRIRLSDEYAKALGLTLNKKDKGRVTARYRLTNEQIEQLEELKGHPIIEVKTTNKTKPNDYEPAISVISAWGSDGKIMNLDEYCEHYNLPRNEISSSKLITHTGIPYYNIVFKDNVEANDLDLNFIRDVLSRELNKTYAYTPKYYKKEVQGVLKWADLHFGAHIRNLNITKDYDVNILENGLNESVDEMNSFKFKKAHVHIHGDLIESFSGLNHINSWMSMDKDLIGSKAVMYCCELLDRVLQRVDNLGCIKITAGNHDRLSKNNDEDVKGGAAELIAWGLQLKGYDVEFHPYVTTHLVDGINYLNFHGDKVISRRTTKDIIWDYGKKGYFNFVCEAHLHSLFEKMTATQRDKYNLIKDDSVDHRRMTLQSFFTGNYYSETLNYNSNGGYAIIWDNGKGLPKVLNSCVS